MKRRSLFKLTTVVTEGGRQVTDARRLEVVVPGVTVLAGDAVAIGASYMKETMEGVTPWETVTGLAWKAPWLYFSQGAHHTIRRVQLAGGVIEEVAGMRGIPGTRKAGEDRLFEPGQLLHRTCTPPGGVQPREEWLVLQPRAGCIQAFTEGEVARSMRVLVGHDPEAERPNPPLDKPTAMAVHGPTGHVFVAELGDRTIKLFSPEGEPIRTVAERVEAHGLAVNERGDVFFADPAHHVIRVLRHLGADLNGASTFAPAVVFAGAEDRAGAVDGPRSTRARFREPMGLALDTLDGDYLLIADTGNHLIRKVRAELASPEAPVETAGGNPHAIQAVNLPVAAHPNGTVAMVNDPGEGISLLSPDGSEVHTLPGSHGWTVSGIALDPEGHLFLSDPAHHVVWILRLLNPPLYEGARPEYGPREVFAGKPGSQGRAEGKRTEALFQRLEGLSLDPKDPAFLLITDAGDQAVWRVPVSLAEDLPVKRHGKPNRFGGASGNAGHKDGPAAACLFSHPLQLCGDGHGGIFVQDQAGPNQSPVLRTIDLAGEVRTLGGINLNTTRRTRADGTGTEAGFDRPMGIAVARSGAVFVADSGNQCVRRILPDGKVTVWGDTREGRSSAEAGNPMEAPFEQLGFLGLDFLERVLLVDPKRKCLHRVEDTLKSKGIPGTKMTTLRKGLGRDQVAIFPASAAHRDNDPLVLTEPTGVHGEASIWFRVFMKEELVDLRVKLQAVCADRRNRIWVAVATDPTRPGTLRIQRYSCRMPRESAQWDREGATLPLFPPDASQEVDGRPYARCAAPRITAMATDSHDNLYLADAENGAIWKVDEHHFTEAAKVEAVKVKAAEAEAARAKATLLAKSQAARAARAAAMKSVQTAPIEAVAADPVQAAPAEPSLAFSADAIQAGAPPLAYAGPHCIALVAGRYPFLGPLGKELQDPLLPMPGLALTPQDDLVVTCGNAVLLITQPLQEAPAPWVQAEPPRPWQASTTGHAKASGEAAPKPRGLINQPLDAAWQQALEKAEGRLLGARNALLAAQASQRAATLAHQASPASLAWMNRAEALLPVIAQAQKAVPMAEAELAAKQAIYDYLMSECWPPSGPSRHDPKTLLGLAGAEGNVKQITYECMRLARKGEALQAPDPRLAALQAEERYLRAVQLAYATEAEALLTLQASKALVENDETVIEIRQRRDAALRLADREAMAFETSPQGQELRRFQSWTKGNPPME